jgi:hypothetical protein
VSTRSRARKRPWIEANRAYLVARLARVERALADHAGLEPQLAPEALPEKIATGMDAPPALETLVELFGLTPFERDLLLLCAGVELDARLAPLCAAAQGNDQQDYPTFGLALAALPGADWAALSPDAALRYWQLITVERGRSLTRSPLRIDERILHYLVGISHLDDELAGLVRSLPAPDDLVPSHQKAAEEIVAAWLGSPAGAGRPVIQLCGAEVAAKRAIAAAGAGMLGLKLYLMPAAALPVVPRDFDRLWRRWQREAALSESVLMLDCDGLDRHDLQRESAISRLVEASHGLLIVSGPERRGPWQRPVLTIDVARPTADEQRRAWRAALGPAAAALNGQVDNLVAQFNLSLPTIIAAASSALGQAQLEAAEAEPEGAVNPNRLGAALWEVCRRQARPQLDDLAQRIDVRAGWDDLVLPEIQRQVLLEIAAQVRQRGRVYEHWGFQAKSNRGLGISALFAGSSGTGKTMAAEVLATDLALDLYRIDLSGVVNKYIGETEKNLRRVFDAAEAGGVILLFDEADALFGKRSEVRDSHDRHANIEVSYLLQRMESYRGLAILTSNLKEALDKAFLRRLRFIVDFPFPRQEERLLIWQGVFPVTTPTKDLDYAKLARLNVAGGSIRNIAVNAAFLAANDDRPVGMGHILHAARREYAKLARPLTAAEIGDWL